MPAGSTSVTVTACATPEPVFVTAIVQLVGEPAVIVPASGVLAMPSTGASSVAVAGSGPAAYGPLAFPLLPPSSFALVSAVLTLGPGPGAVRSACSDGVALKVSVMLAPGARSWPVVHASSSPAACGVMTGAIAPPGEKVAEPAS